MFELLFDIFEILIYIIIPVDVLVSVFSNIYVYKKLGRRFESTGYYRIGFSRQVWIIILAAEILLITALIFKYLINDFNFVLVITLFIPFFVAYNYRFFMYLTEPSALLYNDKGLIVARSPGLGLGGIFNFVSWEQADKIVLQDGGKAWSGMLIKKNRKSIKFKFHEETRKEIEQIFGTRNIPVDVNKEPILRTKAARYKHSVAIK